MIAWTVTFANGVTVVGMPQANLTALLLGLGGAVADAWNRLSINTPTVLLNSAGASIEATVNKSAAGNDAAFAFKTGFSARALIGLLGSDDFSFKVSPDGSAYHDAILIDRSSGRVELPKPAILPAVSSAPAAPASGKLALYARTRAGQPWLDAMRPSGRDISLQPHLGLARTANWLPSSGATVTTEGMSNSTVGTVSTPGLAATSLATSMRRWRLTSAWSVLRLGEATDQEPVARDWLGREGLDGIVAKRLDLPYQSGERAMRKFKLWKTVDCVVAGLYRKRGTQAVEHLLLGLYDEEGLLNYVGRARIYEDAAEIGRLLEPLVGGQRFHRSRAGRQEPLVRQGAGAGAARAGPRRRGQRRSHYRRAHAPRGAAATLADGQAASRAARWIRSGEGPA